MHNLDETINNRPQDLDPLVFAFLVHYQFETIHPFEDGNGRVGRALLSLMICSVLGHSMPWLYLSPFFEKFKEEYVQALFNVSAKGDWDGWIEFCLNGTMKQATDSIIRCKKFKDLQRKYHDLKMEHSSRTHAIIDGLFDSPVLTIAYLALKMEIRYPTAQRDVMRLVDAGILVEIPDCHPRSFYAPEIMSVAHDFQLMDHTSEPSPQPET